MIKISCLELWFWISKLQEGHGRQDRKLAIAHHKRRNGKSEFTIAQNLKGVFSSSDDSFVGNVTANLMGSKYHIWDQVRFLQTSQISWITFPIVSKISDIPKSIRTKICLIIYSLKWLAMCLLFAGWYCQLQKGQSTSGSCYVRHTLSLTHFLCSVSSPLVVIYFPMFL